MRVVKRERAFGTASLSIADYSNVLWFEPRSSRDIELVIFEFLLFNDLDLHGIRHEVEAGGRILATESEREYEPGASGISGPLEPGGGLSVGVQGAEEIEEISDVVQRKHQINKS
jgi:hypothetical protein